MKYQGPRATVINECSECENLLYQDNYREMWCIHPAFQGPKCFKRSPPMPGEAPPNWCPLERWHE
jgi:hypothetical protein